ncbi:hypothetical protein [Mesorhizobium sp. M0060]|uniref:hypothetical protein n=1 Tax=Mesorhizobium sp. M0060 TaxID=2956866 RepID=UPI0033367C3E
MSVDLNLLDRVIADLQTLRGSLASESIAPADEPDQDDDLLDTATAASRFNIPIDTLRWLAREKGMGEKSGGRWLISALALRDYLKREKRE